MNPEEIKLIVAATVLIVSSYATIMCGVRIFNHHYPEKK